MNAVFRFLISIIIACSSALGTNVSRGSEAKPSAKIALNASTAVRYVRSCRKPNGAFGPFDQEYTDAAWTYPAVHTLKLLQADIPDKAAVVKNGLGYPRGHAGYGHWLVYHQSMTAWLLNHHQENESISDARRKASAVRLVHQGFEVRYYGSPFGTGGEYFFNADGPSTRKQFQEATALGFYNLSSLYYLLAALRAEGRTVQNSNELIEFITIRQCPSGGFVDLRSAGHTPADEEAHIAHTFHAVASLILLGSDVPNKNQCVNFIRSCQPRESIELPHFEVTQRDLGLGGFLWNPKTDLPGNLPDVYYTWAGLQSLHLLGSGPISISSCSKWLNSLQNSDGGFGDRPGWRSRLYSTYYAVHSLSLLANMRPEQTEQTEHPVNENPLLALAGMSLSKTASATITEKQLPVPVQTTIPRGEYQIFQALCKTPVVEPDDLDGLSKRGFNLLAMKSDKFPLAEPLLKRIRAEGYSLETAFCPEAYPHRLTRFGGLTLNHVGNFTLSAHWQADERKIWLEADAAGKQGLSWNGYRQQVLAPMQRLGSLCYPEQDFEMEFAYSAYDDGLYGNNGYNAIQVGFNWTPRDFVRVFPWRERYTDKLPPVADADAHGDLKKWSPQLDHVRQLYIARDSSYEEFIAAAREGRTVCVIAQPEGVESGYSLYGTPAAVAYVKESIDQWKWW